MPVILVHQVERLEVASQEISSLLYLCLPVNLVQKQCFLDIKKKIHC